MLKDEPLQEVSDEEMKALDAGTASRGWCGHSHAPLQILIRGSPRRNSRGHDNDFAARGQAMRRGARTREWTR